MIKIRSNEYLKRLELTNYRKSLRNYLMTSRFNNKTLLENERYIKSRNDIGCIYCTPCPVPELIPLGSILFVLEMNNDSNKINGIGMISNIVKIGKHSVYEENNYNRYNYVGKYRINRCDMTELEEMVMKIFDSLCFYGNKHMKRGQGIKMFPLEMLYRCQKKIDLIEVVGEMFKCRYSSNISKEYKKEKEEKLYKCLYEDNIKA